MLRIVMLASLVAVAILAACGDDGGPPIPSDPRPASVIVENQSQYELQELRIHSEPVSGYMKTQNRLESPMAIEGAFLFHERGDWYVTVFRERNRGGPMLALTTGEPISLTNASGYKLLVFDDSFRLAPSEYVPDPDDVEAGK